MYYQPMVPTVIQPPGVDESFYHRARLSVPFQPRLYRRIFELTDVALRCVFAGKVPKEFEGAHRRVLAQPQRRLQLGELRVFGNSSKCH